MPHATHTQGSHRLEHRRRRLIERTGKTNVDARREKCVGFGHDVCVVRVKW